MRIPCYTDLRIAQPLSGTVWSRTRRWRNWQTHKLEVLAPQGIGVQVPSSAPIQNILRKALFPPMVIVLVILHVLVAFFLIGVVLLQQGKSADLAAAFGGQGSQT